ncbi:MAG: alanyl-tRNA editing protein, partial [Spirochaetota bacterium]
MGDAGRALYYEDPLLDTCSALVLSSEEGGRLLELDRTLFFPEGGGQPCDLGTIDGLSLEAVQDEGGRVLHRLREPSDLATGSRVELVLDRPRRMDHAAQHSAQHLLSGLFWNRGGVQTRSFHLGVDHSTIDLDMPVPNETVLDEVEARANAMIAEGPPYVVHRCPPEDPAKLDLRKPPPEGIGEIRIVEIAGLDFSPCCGTHVANARELRIVKILETERYKGLTRLSFVAGGRAVRRLARVYASARSASKVLSAPIEDLAPEALRLVKRVRDNAASPRDLLRALVSLGIDRAREGGLGFVPLELPGPGADTADEGIRGLSERGLAGLIVVREALTVAV